ncbi:ABC transporter substrate-binding protein, partial [Halobium palmae]
TSTGTAGATSTTAAGNAAESKTRTEGSGDGSYSVTMAPVGEVEFDEVPTDFLTYYPISAGTAVALGHGDSINALGYDKQLFGNTVDYYYDSLDGVSFEWEGLGRVTPGDNPGTLDEELFYELDSDVHFLDPCLLRSGSFGWSEAEVSGIAADVGPWFGNYYSRTNADPPEGCRDRYDYYSLWGYIGKIAAVLREEDRFRALKSIRDEVVGRVRAALPPRSERPSVAIVAYSDGTFWPYDFTQAGYLWAHVRPFGATNALATADVGASADGSYDYEALVEAAPDVVLRYWGTARGDTFLTNRSELLDHPLAEEVPAFRNGRYYASGNGMQGPITNLFQLEMTAKQLYPEQFGAWPGFGDGESYPTIPSEERLFDRERVVDVVTGEF